MTPQPPFTLDALVRAAARRDRGAPAVRHKDEVLTYGELDDLVDAVAGGLARIGVKKGDRVGLYQPKSVNGVAAIAGILRAGAAYVPIDPQAPWDRARWIMEHCGLEVLFGAGRPLKQALAGGQRIARAIVSTDGDALPEGSADLRLAFEELASGPREVPRAPADLELAYILYTSGSTGAPKGVAITHGQSLTFVRTAAEDFRLSPADVLASHAPFNFDLSIIDLFCAFAAGAEVVLIPETWLAFPARVSQLIEEAGITVWNSVPSALVQIVQHGALDRRDLSKLRLAMFAGEPFPLRHLRRLKEALPGATLLNVYGQTEANSSTRFAIDRLPDSDDAPLPVGKAFPNYEVFLIDDRGSLVTGPGVEGEIHVAGGAVASGYFRDPERSTKAFVENPLRPEVRQIVYKTGDRAVWNEDGDLVFRGRLDTAVKVRGFRVEPAEIEAAVSALPGVSESAVVPAADEEAGHRLVLFVALEEGARLSEPEILGALHAKLPRYMMPDAVCFEPRLPRSPTGKVDRKALLEPARRALARGA